MFSHADLRFRHIVNGQQLCRPIEVLLVEDNAGDIELTRQGIKERKVQVNLNVIMDGTEAMAYLRRTGKHARAARPDIVLFDLNLPGKDGGEVLAEIKADPDLDMIPVVVLTTSESEEDLLGAYKLKANCYINKPVDFDQFVKIVQ